MPGFKSHDRGYDDACTSGTSTEQMPAFVATEDLQQHRDLHEGNAWNSGLEGLRGFSC
jgi:hypothetical protein